MGQILLEPKENLQKCFCKRWTIKIFNTFLKILVLTTSFGIETLLKQVIWGQFGRGKFSILLLLLVTHGRSLNDESLRTLLAETEAISNSGLLTVETLGDVKSKQPLSPNNILTMTTKVVMPPPGEFVRADEFSRMRWRRGQSIANEF